MPTSTRVNAAGLIVAGSSNPNWKGGKVSKNCLRCGTVFFVPPGRSSAARFCTLPCFNAWQRETHASQGVLKKPNAPRLVVCEWCDTPFQVTPALVGRQRYCSKDCFNAAHSPRMRGAGNPNWQGGVSRLPYPFDWAAISRRVRRRDGRNCLNPLCRGTYCRLTVHHIDYDKMNVSEANLITVCCSCNSRANYRRSVWTRMYQRLMRRLYPSLFTSEIGA